MCRHLVYNMTIVFRITHIRLLGFLAVSREGVADIYIP